MRLGQPNQSQSVKKMLALFLLATVCLVLSGCHLWYQDMKGYLEYWTGTVSIGNVSWSASPASQKDASGVDTISTNATITATVDIVNPDGYPLDGRIGSASDAIRSMRISGEAGAAALAKASVTSSSLSGMKVEIDSFSQVPTPDSLALEHKSFTVHVTPTRSDNGVSVPNSRSLTFRYNTPPRMPLAVVKDSSGAFRWPQSGDRWDVSSQGPLYYAWPQDKTKSGGGNPTDPDYAARFYIEDTGTGKWYPEPDCLEAGQTLAGSDGTVYNIYKYQPTGTNVTVYAEDGEGVRGAGIVSGALTAITLDANGGSFGTSSSVTVYRADGASLSGGDLDIPTMSGYYLSGWTIGGNQVTFPYTVSGPTTFTAQWTAAASSGSGSGSGGSTPVVDPYSFYVNPSSGSDSNTGTQASPLKTIQAAVDKIVAANDGTSAYSILLMDDVVDSSSGAYDSSRNSALVDIVPGKRLNLTVKSDSDGTKRTIDAGRDSSNTGRVFYVGANASVTLQDLVVTGGYVQSDNGGGILAKSATTGLTLTNCEVSNNTVENGNGGGLYVAYDASAGAMELTLQSTKVNSNTIIHNDFIVTYSGAGVGIENSAVTLEISDSSEINENKMHHNNNTATNPTAEGIGLWLGNSATATIENSTVSENVLATTQSASNASGGGIHVGGGTLTLGSGTVVEKNYIFDASGWAQGGGIYIAGGRVTLEGNATISANEARNGGGVFVSDGTLEMSGGEISGNFAGFDGGGVYVSPNATFTMTGGSIKANEVGAGAGSYSGGGGVYVNGGTFTMEDGEITQNSGLKCGGGVNVGGSGTFEMSGGEISDNTAVDGGGVYAGGTLNMNGGEISGNTASGSGGGIYIDVDGTLSMTGGTIEQNLSSFGGDGVHTSGATSTVNMGGSAVIAQNNDILLSTGTVITITSPLTGTVPVATISPFNYNVSTQVLAAGPGVTLANEVGKFAVVPNPTGSGSYVVAVDSSNPTSGVLSNGAFTTGTEAASQIASLSGNCTVRITGALTADQIANIKKAIDDNISITVSLDLSGVALPGNAIPQDSFKDCSSLVGITLPDSITEIAASAFYGCTGLTSVVIPDSVHTIGDNAFMYCGKLASVRIEATTPPKLGSSVFLQNDPALQIQVPAGSLSDYQAAPTWQGYASYLVEY